MKYSWHGMPMRWKPLPRLGLMVLCAGVLTLGCVFYVWQRYQYVRLGFEVSLLSQRKQALEAQLEPMEVELQYLSRLERIETLAVKQLGMKPPQPRQVILLEDDETATNGAD